MYCHYYWGELWGIRYLSEAYPGIGYASEPTVRFTLPNCPCPPPMHCLGVSQRLTMLRLRTCQSFLPGQATMYRAFSPTLPRRPTERTRHGRCLSSIGCQTPADWKPANEKYPVMAKEEVMAPKSHGTSRTPVQQNLRYGCDVRTAAQICNFNRHCAEHAGYFINGTSWAKDINPNEVTTYYDSNTVLHLSFT